jgi:hypothetical protein
VIRGRERGAKQLLGRARSSEEKTKKSKQQPTAAAAAPTTQHMRGERDESEGTTPMKQCEYVFEERQQTSEMDERCEWVLGERERERGQQRWMISVNGF